MANASDYLEGVLASHMFGSGTFAKPTVLAVALTGKVSVDADTGSLTAGVELANTGAYARQTLNPSATNWTDPVGVGGVVNNLAAISYPTATADWGWISGVAICSSATYGAGNHYIWGSLTTPKLIGNGDSFTIPISGVSVTIS